jgi:hypothetical protein
MAPTVTVSGNFCDHYHADVFSLVLSGDLPLANLGRTLRLVCTNKNTNNGHSDMCQRTYNFRDMVVSSSTLIAFVNENWKELRVWPRITEELVGLVANMKATIDSGGTSNDHVSIVGFLCNTPAITIGKVRRELLKLCKHGEGVPVPDYHALLEGGVLSRADLGELRVSHSDGHRCDMMAVIEQYQDWVLDTKAPLVHIPLTNSCIVSLVRQIMVALETKLPMEIVCCILYDLFPKRTVRAAIPPRFG